jgi:hypothetical protein
MLTRTEASIEAVAAFLYNAIYDQDGKEGWTPEESLYDPTYRQVFLCFAEAVMKALEAEPEASRAEVVRQAAKLIDRKRAGFSWEFIAIDERLVSLLQAAEPHIDGVRDFLDNPDGYPEGEFLQRESAEAGEER